MRPSSLLSVVAVLAAAFILQSIPFVSASQDDPMFYIDLVDDDGNVITGKLTDGSPLSFDTDSDHNGTRYRLKSSVVIDTIPVNLRITAQSGKYNINVAAADMSSFLSESGLRISIGGGHIAELDRHNGYRSDVMAAGRAAVFEPNTMYPISISTLHGVDTMIEPDTAGGVTFTFAATVSDGYHHVMFISRDKVVDVRILRDGDIIDLPSVRGSIIREVGGWYTSDGREITNGHVLTEEDGDIIATAEWIISKSTIAVIIIGTGCALYLMHICRRGTL